MKETVKISGARYVIFLAMMFISLGLVGWVIWYISDGTFLFSEPTLWILGALLFLVVSLLLIKRTTIDQNTIVVRRGFTRLCCVNLNEQVYYQFGRLDARFSTELTLYVSNNDFEDDGSAIKLWKPIRLKRDNKYRVAAVPYTSKVAEVLQLDDWVLVPGGDNVTPNMAAVNDKHDRFIWWTLGVIWIVFLIWMLFFVGQSPFADVTYFEPEEDTSTILMQNMNRDVYSYRMQNDGLTFDEFDIIDFAPNAEYIKCWTEIDRFAKESYRKKQIADEFELRYPGIESLDNIDVKLTEDSHYYYLTLTASRMDYAPKGAKVLRAGFHSELAYEDGAIYLQDALKSLKRDGFNEVPPSQRDELLKKFQGKMVFTPTAS